MVHTLKKKLKGIYKSISKRIFSILKKLFMMGGYSLIKNHFYSPIPEKADLPKDYWDTCSDLVGIDIKTTPILKCLSELDCYFDEFRSLVPMHQVDGNDAYLINSSFMAVDAHMYYSFVRHFEPKKIIEIGSGFSTIFAQLAIAQNKTPCALTAIEPYPNKFLQKLAKNGSIKIIPKKLQKVDLEIFSSLSSNDILFIDSTHMLRVGSDVQIEYCEILPRLASGVLIHIHDVSLPKHYPSVYFDNDLYWNEQYLLQAFLSFNSKFEIIWPGNYMMINFADQLRKKFPEFEIMRQYFPMSEPTSFWMRVKE